jgi:hypothetical protein
VDNNWEGDKQLHYQSRVLLQVTMFFFKHDFKIPSHFISLIFLGTLRQL